MNDKEDPGGIWKFILLLFLIAVLFTLLPFAVVSYARAPAPIEIIETIAPIDYADAINKISEEYNVDREIMEHIIFNESRFNPNAVGDMHITCERTGDPVYARGLAQITRCFYPDVTDEQAFNADYSMRFLAEHLSQGLCDRWTTCPL